MAFDLSSVLKLLPAVGPVVAALPEFKAIYDQIVGTFKQQDQVMLLEAYADLITDNDESHTRLQEKLAAASKK